MLKEELFDIKSFIGGWYIDKLLCDALVDFHEANKDKVVQGTVGKRIVDKSTKDSLDLRCRPNGHPVIKEYQQQLQKCLDLYLERYESANNVNYFAVHENIAIQKYEKKGGFKKWHCENQGYPGNIQRYLVFMTYLNDVKDGGTEFKYQKIKTEAIKGLTLIWPAFFTHTHKGVISNEDEKYIITGWYSFNGEEQND
tara:strand:- start:747 stop:1337 length:591 start_codon:yes stop_codon:yes gene_type:complete